MTRFTLGVLLLVLSTACAPTARVSSGPGSSAATRMYRVNALSFEAPAPFSTRSLALIEFLVNQPRSLSSSRSSGVTLTFCAERDMQACGALGVRLRDDLTADQCADRDYVRRWLGFGEKAEAALQPATLAERSGWLVPVGGPGAERMLLLCDGAQFWMVKAVALGEKGAPPANQAFDLFLRTARFGVPLATAHP